MLCLAQPTLFDSGTTRSTPSGEYSSSSESLRRDRPSIRSSLLVAATGLGKTCIMAGIASHWPTGRVMMISHRFELNQQAIRQFERICGCDVDLEQAQWRADQRAVKTPIVVASVQTLVSRNRGRRRMERFDPYDFGLLMIDESHRAAANSYLQVIEHFQQNPDLRVLGVTATPDRLDGVGLGSVFQGVACDLNMRWGIEHGWLVPIKQKFVDVKGLDLRSVRTKGGDLDERQLAKIVEQEATLHEMAKPIADVCGATQRGLVFTTSVLQARQLAEIIQRYGCRSESLDGETPAPKRKQMLDDYAAGLIQVLVNCGVLTEGFDAPATEVVAICRPTKSRALYTQCVGRGTRPLPGVVDGADDRHAAIAASTKPWVTVLDFVGNSGRHELVAVGDILAGSEPPEIVARSKVIVRRGNFDGTAIDALELAKEEKKREELER
jgi:superfamily II DNA or RNA helicase